MPTNPGNKPFFGGGVNACSAETFSPENNFLADPSSKDGNDEQQKNTELHSFMRIVLDEMPEDPDPVKSGSQGTVVDADPYQILIDWDVDVGRSLHLIPGVDRYHVINPDSDTELEKSFLNLSVIQDRLRSEDWEAVDDSRCPRCGQLFDARRGAVSRYFPYDSCPSVDQIMVCPQCGTQEAIEQFVLNSSGLDINVHVPLDRNHTGYESEPAVDESGNAWERLRVNVLGVEDWYIVRIWTGMYVDSSVVDNSGSGEVEVAG